MQVYDSPYAVVYWGPRKESVEECVARVLAFFRRIAEIDPVLSRWFRTAYSRKQALRSPVLPSEATFRKLLVAGRNRTDTDRKIIEDLGFHISFWNGGEDDDDVRVAITCGSYAPRMSNSCILNFSESGSGADRLLQTPVMIELFQCMLDIWDAERGVVGSHGYHELRADSSERTPRIGWLTYVPSHLGRVPPLPPPSKVRAVGRKGTLIIVTPERFTVNNPAHVAAADRVTAILEEAGLRKPSTPQSA